MKSKLLVIVFLASMMSFTGCAAEPKDLSGQTLPPKTADEVALFEKKPSSYDIVGMMSIPLTADLTWDDRADANKAFNLLKAKAGAMGADGVLFEIDKGDYDVTATAGYHGKFYAVPIKLQPPKMIVAKAILIRSK